MTISSHRLCLFKCDIYIYFLSETFIDRKGTNASDQHTRKLSIAIAYFNTCVRFMLCSCMMEFGCRRSCCLFFFTYKAS